MLLVGYKEIFKMRRVLWMVILVGFTPLVYGQQQEEIKKLEQKVKMLEQRLNYLEKNASPAGVSRDQLADEIEKRLSDLEAKYNQWNGPKTFRAYWKNGLRLDTLDKSFRLKIGGRIQYDWAWYADSDMRDIVGDLQDGTEFRRARIYMAGQIYDDIIFKANYDFAGNGNSDFRDVWIGMKNVPIVGNIKAGRFDEPMGLEVLTSDKYITFMERSLTEALLPAKNNGFMIYNTAFNKRMTWAVGVFKNAADGSGRA